MKKIFSIFIVILSAICSLQAQELAVQSFLLAETDLTANTPGTMVQDQNGNTVNSGQLLGRKTVIYFYPKDNTSGCTEEACNLRDNYQALLAKGYNVIGRNRPTL